MNNVMILLAKIADRVPKYSCPIKVEYHLDTNEVLAMILKEGMNTYKQQTKLDSFILV